MSGPLDNAVRSAVTLRGVRVKVSRLKDFWSARNAPWVAVAVVVAVCVWYAQAHRVSPTDQSWLFAHAVVAREGCYKVNGATGVPKGWFDVYLPTSFRLRQQRSAVDNYLYGYSAVMLDAPYGLPHTTGKVTVAAPDSLLVNWGSVIYRFRLHAGGHLSGIAILNTPSVLHSHMFGTIDAQIVSCDGASVHREQ